MVKYFDREFPHLDSSYKQELYTLESNGCIHTEFVPEGGDGFEPCRIQFKPDEIVGYVDALKAYDEYSGFVDQGLTRSEALNSISDDMIIQRVKEYNAWAEQDAPELIYCPAAFLGGHLESLVCGGEPERYEFLQQSYSGDRRYLLKEIIAGFGESVASLNDRDGGRPDFEVSCEQDVQDLLYAMMKPIFPDSRDEEYTTKHATNSKKIDFVIPEISTIIETKYVRDSRHAGEIPNELKIDIESYHTHSECERMIIVIWDENSHIKDRHNFREDLSGPRSIGGTDFHVDVRFVP